MPGDRLGESSGTFTSIRGLPSEGHQVWLEVFQGRGTLLGQQITDTGTYRQTFSPGGVLHGEGHVLMLSKNGASPTGSVAALAARQVPATRRPSEYGDHTRRPPAG
jgi:hypothetical protein